MKINKIEEIKKLNIICTNAEETKECFSILEKLGLPIVEYSQYNNSDIIVKLVCTPLTNEKHFITSKIIFDLYININFYDFKKETKKFLKQVSKEEPKYLITHAELLANVGKKVTCQLLKDGSETQAILREKNDIIYICQNIVGLSNKFDNNESEFLLSQPISSIKQKFEDDKRLLSFKIKLLEEPKLPDIEVDEGRVIKINNWNSDKTLFITGSYKDNYPIKLF